MNLGSPINILHIVRSFDVSGRSRLIHDICRGCKMDGSTSAVVSLTDNCGYKQSDSDLISLGIGSGFKLSAVFRLAKIIRCRKISVIHNHGRGSLIYAALVSLLFPRIKLVHTVHRADGDLISRHGVVRKWVLGRVDEVVAVSESAALDFSNVNGCSVDEIKVIYNGIKISGFSNVVTPAKDEGAFVIGTVANLSADKDIDTLLRAFANMVRGDVVETGHALSLPHTLRLRIIGDGPRADELHDLAKKLGIYKNVDFLGFRKDVPEQLAEFDVFVLSTKTEGFGISILEAMASGVPVVASRIGGVPEIVEDGKNGLLFEVGNVQGLVDAVMKMVKDDAMREMLVANAAEDVKRKFSNEIMLSEYKRLLMC